MAAHDPFAPKTAPAPVEPEAEETEQEATAPKPPLAVRRRRKPTREELMAELRSQ